ncbi:MAG: hypothetical protein Q8N26_35635 [Myxococcales bacterium]|nr:hypothetical protein [Myxococcales bacterium]
MPKQPAVADYLTAIAKALKGAGVRWYVFGAQAVVRRRLDEIASLIDDSTLRSLFDDQLKKARRG